MDCTLNNEPLFTPIKYIALMKRVWSIISSQHPRVLSFIPVLLLVDILVHEYAHWNFEVVCMVGSIIFIHESHKNGYMDFV